MRRVLLVVIASWLAIGLSACTAHRLPYPWTHTETTRLDNARADTAKACAEWRWIGISRPGSRCPETRGWTVHPLFPQLAPVLPSSGDYCKKEDSEKIPDLKLIEELNRFCVYEIADRSKRLEDLPFPPAVSAELVRFDQDCAALAASADPDPAAKPAKPWTPVDEDFLVQAGKPEVPLPIKGRMGVRLAFLDTQPTYEGIPEKSGNSPHGYVLAHIAKKLICTSESEGPCAAQITTQLALPIIDFNAKDPSLNRIDPHRGGYIGMQSDLAAAILNEVESWLKVRQSEGSQRRLVLNLSLAWDGELFGGLDVQRVAEMRAGTQAVYQALQYATSLDVLVLAAAGNQKRDPCKSYGPLLPGAWESQAPQEESCGKPRKWPLLYAVGGLQADSLPLGNARVGGMPRCAAYGESILYTGSSIATAVASSIAAVVWDSYPDLPPYEVMDILYRSGDELRQPMMASFWSEAGSLVPSTPPPVHKLSLCKALREACLRHSGRPGSCPTCDPLKEVRRSGRGKVSPAMKGSCEPWVYPQPDDPPRPNCAGCPPKME